MQTRSQTREQEVSSPPPLVVRDELFALNDLDKVKRSKLGLINLFIHYNNLLLPLHRPCPHCNDGVHKLNKHVDDRYLDGSNKVAFDSTSDIQELIEKHLPYENTRVFTDEHKSFDCLHELYQHANSLYEHRGTAKWCLSVVAQHPGDAPVRVHTNTIESICHYFEHISIRAMGGLLTICLSSLLNVYFVPSIYPFPPSYAHPNRNTHFTLGGMYAV